MRKIIDGLWDTRNLGNVNDNFEQLFDDIDSTRKNLINEVWDKLKDSNEIKMEEPVPSYADLPSDDAEKTLRVVEDEQKVYVRTDGKWIEFSPIDLDPYGPIKNDLAKDLEDINEAKDAAVSEIQSFNPINHSSWQKSKLTEDDGTVLQLTNIDFNNLQDSVSSTGTYYIENATGSPSVNHGYLEAQVKDGNNMRVLFSPNDGTNHVIVRKLVNGKWGEWENESSKLERLFGLTTLGVNLYVSNSKGNDDSGDGSKNKPYKTIQKAFDSIPKVIDKRWTVNIEPGNYNEEAYLTGVIGGAIYVRSDTTVKPDVMDNIDVRVKALNFFDVIGYVHIEDVGTYGGEINRKAFILFSRCIYGSVSRCRMDRSIGDKYTMYWDGSYGSFGTSYMDNQDICVQVQNGSTVRIEHSIRAGSNNGLALRSENGLIFKRGDTAWIDKAATPEYTENGGQIYEDYVWETLPLANGWAVESGLPLRVKKINRDFAFLYGWVNKSALDTTKISGLPTKYRPLHTQRNSVVVTGTAANQDALPILDIKADGTIVLVNTGSVPSNNGLAINITYPLR